MHEKLSIFLYNFVTFKNWNKLQFGNQLLMVVTTLLSEIMNECRDGKVLVDIYALFSNGFFKASFLLLIH